MPWNPPWKQRALGALGQVVEVDPASGIRWVLIPAGSVTTNRGVKLTVPRPFLMAETPVTQAQWVRAMSGPGLIVNNPSYHRAATWATDGKDDPNRPVETVSALEADEFARRVGGRLPTEEEWEYASLGGSSRDPYGPIFDIAWVYENSGRKTHPVGQKQPNAFGLYDMLGNVRHWTETMAGPSRVHRGGSFDGDAEFVRASDRGWNVPGARGRTLGFRPVKDLPSTYGRTRTSKRPPAKPAEPVKTE